MQFEDDSSIQYDERQVLVRSSRSKLIYRVILFQFKLAADGIRDLLLSPLSIIAGILGILFSSNDPHYYLDKLLKTGQVSDRWINLFDSEPSRHNANNRETLDGLARRFEEAVRRDYERNGVSAKAAKKFEDVLKDIKSRHC
ncbi:MAG: hypothetical protein COB78_08935 [Hyphomicrobiales bacterium]|nr:MAG: hypothetical protein COB78_08935 [Hyphomicrobiales bacterium]